MSTDADTCRTYVLPRLLAAGWDRDPHAIAEQHVFTDGRIVVAGGKARRHTGKRADYVLRYARDFPIAVVEAKRDYKLPSDGLQQAKEYAEILGLKFAYATNGAGVVEFDYLTGLERSLEAFPSPEELWSRLRAAQGINPDTARRLLTPVYRQPGWIPRYYQEIAINRAVQSISQGNRRVLLTMATGTGKTLVAFHICWKLWSARWNRTGEHRRTRVLYLADRNILVDDPKDNKFAPFGEARWKIEHGVAIQSRELYFSTYQAIARDERRPGLYRAYAPDFFDLIVVDECHRGSASDQSNWREILDYFSPAYQLGMTATPKRADNVDTYAYFGEPLYTYSLRQGIDDGFLAPYRVHQVITSWDAAGWRPSEGDLDRYGREIPDEEYQTKDFERVVALRARTEAIARHLSDFLKASNRYDKTIVFCVDQEHADEMRRALNNLNADLVKQHPDYVCRVTADEGDVGRGHLDDFKDVETLSPVILTTSQLLTTGVDVPTCKNIVLVRVIGSMTEFKQIIGRGTRVRDDYGKLFFNILDYTGLAVRMFADPEFDGDPISTSVITIDEEGRIVGDTQTEQPESPTDISYIDEEGAPPPFPGDVLHETRKYYFDEGSGNVVHYVVRDLTPDGKQLRMVAYADYTAEVVRVLYGSTPELRAQWASPDLRAAIVEKLEKVHGVSIETLADATGQPEADPLDLLCHVAFNAPLRTRRERAARVRSERRDFFDRYGPGARQVLDELLEKYAEHGTAQFAFPDVLKVPPISERGNVREIAALFGGSGKLKEAVTELQELLYAA